jgi:hypothetical protein
MPQSGQKSSSLLYVLYPAPLKQFIERFKIFLNSLFRFLFNGIQLHLDVISINTSIFLHYQIPQLSLIGWRWLQPPEPFLGFAPHIQLHDLEQFICI